MFPSSNSMIVHPYSVEPTMIIYDLPPLAPPGKHSLAKVSGAQSLQHGTHRAQGGTETSSNAQGEPSGVWQGMKLFAACSQYTLW